MLAGQRALVLDRQVRGVRAEGAEHAAPGIGAQVEVDADVHTSRTEMAVHDAGQSMPVQEFAEFGQVSGEELRPHRRVLPSRPRGERGAGVRIGEVRAEPGAVLPDAPQVRTLAGIVDAAKVAHVAGGPELRGKQVRIGEAVSDVIGTDFWLGRFFYLDEQPGVAIGEIGDGVGAAARAHGLDDDLVDPLDRGGAVPQQQRHVARGVDDVGVSGDDERGALGPGDDRHGRRGDDGAGPLATDEGARDVETLLGQQVTQVVTGHLARDAAELDADRGEVVGSELAQFALEMFGAGAGRPIVGIGGANPRARRGETKPVGGDQAQLDDVIGGAAVAHRVVAAGVVADGAAEACPGLARRVGREREARVGRLVDRGADVGEHGAGLRRGGAGGLVDGQHAIHVAREVEDEARTDRVAGHGGAPAAGCRRDAEPVAHGESGGDLVLGAREEHGHRHDAVVRGVEGVLGDAPCRGLRGEPRLAQRRDEFLHRGRGPRRLRGGRCGRGGRRVGHMTRLPPPRERRGRTARSRS